MTVKALGNKNGSSFVKVLAIAIVSTVSVLGLGACGNAPEREADSVSVVDDNETSDYIDYSGGSGMGITYTGKVGIDLGGGLYMPMGGGTPQLGYGF